MAQALSRQNEGLMKLLQQREHTCAAWLAAMATHSACTSITVLKRSCSIQQISRSEPRDRTGQAIAMHRACAKMLEHMRGIAGRNRHAQCLHQDSHSEAQLQHGTEHPQIHRASEIALSSLLQKPQANRCSQGRFQPCPAAQSSALPICASKGACCMKTYRKEDAFEHKRLCRLCPAEPDQRRQR